MGQTDSVRPTWAVAVALSAIAFGVLTVIVGGMTLLDDRGAQASKFVPFVLWFNFAAGFAYVAAGIGLLVWRRWAASLSAAIAASTLVVFAAFGVHVIAGGAFEPRTAWAMTLRSLVWLAIAISVCRSLGCIRPRVL